MPSRGEPVDAATLEHLVDLARRAPAAGNSQGRAFVVLEATSRPATGTWPCRPSARPLRLARAAAAPVLVVVLVRPGGVRRALRRSPTRRRTGLGDGAGAWPQPFWWFDAGIAVEPMLLGAVEAGLGACLFGLFDHEAAVLEALGVPAGLARASASSPSATPRPTSPASPPAAAAGHRSTRSSTAAGTGEPAIDGRRRYGPPGRGGDRTNRGGAAPAAGGAASHEDARARRPADARAADGGCSCAPSGSASTPPSAAG